ncbi:MAG: PAS domain S-box protein [Bacteroidota bacterium]
MSERKKNTTWHGSRSDLWIVTGTMTVMIILLWFVVLFTGELPLTLRSIVSIHADNPVLFLPDLFPLLVFILLNGRRKIQLREMSEVQAKLDLKEKLLINSTRFARELSEGDDPSVAENMLESELGQALRLIQLNIKTNRRTESEKNWIAEGKDVISRILRNYNNLDELSYQVLKSLSNYISSLQGAIYIFDNDSALLINRATYAYNRRKYPGRSYRIGEGLVGQCAYEMDFIYRTEIPDHYMSVSSGILGEQKPKSIVLVPLITNETLQGVMEFAFLQNRVPKLTIQFLLELGEIIARTVFNLKITVRTEQLLNESRNLTVELKNNEIKLQESAVEMRRTQEQLRLANEQLEKRISEAHHAQNRLHWLLENASEIISIYDKDKKLSYISPSVNSIFGYSPEEMMAGKDFERISREGAAGLHAALNSLLLYPDSTQEFAYSFIRKDGERLWLTASCRNLISDPSINGFVINSHDITASRLMEKEQRLKTRMQALSENSLDFILRISLDETIYYVNPIVEDYTSIHPAGVLNRNLSETGFPDAIRSFFQQTLHRISVHPAKINTQFTFPVQMGDRTTERILNFDAIPEFQENELETVLFVGHDITEAKKIEQEIRIINKNIKDSINYAERIQSSILPEMSRVMKTFPKSFIWYRPRDVISGDFPWFLETENASFIAVIDCTGHGVPGALLSFVGFFLLNNIILSDSSLNPAEICGRLNLELRRTLKQDRERPDTQDGMDIALCKISKEAGRLEFAGAHRPLYLLSEGELTVFKGDSRAIGGYSNPQKDNQPFTDFTANLHRGDKLFIFSDGLTDQLGGPQNLKFGTKGLRNLIVENPGFTLIQYRKKIESEFYEWMGSEKQLDDLLLIGIEY